MPRGSAARLAAQIEELDRDLLRAVPAQFAEVADWMEQRRLAVQNLARSAPGDAEMDAIQRRTNQLEEKFLHWRRAFIMDLSLIDQHLRFVAEQPSGTEQLSGVHLDIRG